MLLFELFIRYCFLALFVILLRNICAYTAASFVSFNNVEVGLAHCTEVTILR